MANVVRHPVYRMTVEDPPNSEIEVPVELYSDPVQSEAIGQITRVLTVEIADEPSIFRGQECTLYQDETLGSTSEIMFKGVIHNTEATAFPNVVKWHCVSYKARLRKVPTYDHDLSGMTDGEAVMHALDQCNVPYNIADIADSGYVLGAIRPVYWLKDQPGHELIAQIDNIFGFATIDIGASTAIRFKQKRTPLNADVEYTYTQGVDAHYENIVRTQGGADDLVNVVNVTGLSWTYEEDEPEADGCTRSYWARAYGFHELLGDDEFNRGYMFSSDFIQSERLAKRTARNIIRDKNRTPDIIRLTALNDLNVRCGTVIGVSDTAYGIDLPGGAGTNPYMVESIVRTGDSMTCIAIGGSAGEFDELESGIERVCNKNGTSTTTDPPPWEDA